MGRLLRSLILPITPRQAWNVVHKMLRTWSIAVYQNQVDLEMDSLLIISKGSQWLSPPPANHFLQSVNLVSVQLLAILVVARAQSIGLGHSSLWHPTKGGTIQRSTLLSDSKLLWSKVDVMERGLCLSGQYVFSQMM